MNAGGQRLVCVSIHVSRVMGAVAFAREYQEVHSSRFHARPTRLRAMKSVRTIRRVASVMVRADRRNDIDPMKVGSDDHLQTHPDKER
jgi:hypothetical protein